MIKIFLAAFISGTCLAETVFTKDQIKTIFDKEHPQAVDQLAKKGISTNDLYDLVRAIRLLNDPVVTASGTLAISSVLLLVSRQLSHLMEKSGDIAYALEVYDTNEGDLLGPVEADSYSLQSILFKSLNILMLKTFDIIEIKKLLAVVHFVTPQMATALDAIEDACTRKLELFPQFVGSGNQLMLASLQRHLRDLLWLGEGFRNLN